MSGFLHRILQHLDVLCFWAAALWGEKMRWEEELREK